ncbi:MAG: sigma-70 family RNA polymerase sigma factor [Phycisphaerae bacterium]|nr:sigma-70 family RNA polymerase sigma factor [Phycisphaerae bacterium]
MRHVIALGTLLAACLLTLGSTPEASGSPCRLRPASEQLRRELPAPPRLVRSVHACSARRLALTIADRCTARVRRWPPPPGWSRHEWIMESAANAAHQALQAEQDFDARRGVPIEAFIWKRVLGRLLAIYRREWRQQSLPKRLMALERVQHQCGSAASASLDGTEDLLKGFTENDRWLLKRALIDHLSESRIAAELGVTQQAVNKRLRALRGRLQAVPA